MSEEDIKALRAAYAAMSRRGWNTVLNVAHRDFTLTTPGGGLVPETTRGVGSARQTFEDFFRPFEALSVEPEVFLEGEGQIVVFFRQRARPSGSTGYVEVRAAHLWTMRDGKATGLEIFPRREKALKAAGLSE